MLKTLVSRLIHNLGREGYVVDDSISSIELLLIIFSKGIEVIRGIFARPFFLEVHGLLFLGKGCTFIAPRKIRMGRSVIIGSQVEINALSKDGVVIGNNTTIKKRTIIECTGVLRSIGEGITIGNNVGISQNCFFQVRGRIVIEDNVIIGPGVMIFSENHRIDNPDEMISMQGEIRSGITVESNVWIGAGAIILDDVRIGKNSVIAAGAVVSKNVKPYSIVAGIPARVIKERKIN